MPGFDITKTPLNLVTFRQALLIRGFARQRLPVFVVLPTFRIRSCLFKAKGIPKVMIFKTGMVVPVIVSLVRCVDGRFNPGPFIFSGKGRQKLPIVLIARSNFKGGGQAGLGIQTDVGFVAIKFLLNLHRFTLGGVGLFGVLDTPGGIPISGWLTFLVPSHFILEDINIGWNVGSVNGLDLSKDDTFI